jgi:hypothetical protein
MKTLNVERLLSSTNHLLGSSSTTRLWYKMFDHTIDLLWHFQRGEMT